VRFLAALCLAIAPLLSAGSPAVPTELDRVEQKRAVELSEHLRCLVCQNQTIADSNAELAQDLRRQVREQIKQGRSDEQIVSFMVQRYGDFVLYKPPVKGTTLLLWFGPALLLLVGFFVLMRNVRVRAKHVDSRPLSDEQHAQASALLDQDAPGKDPA
jgi:cytochrome c-type biogenesis protein CcmH